MMILMSSFAFILSLIAGKELESLDAEVRYVQLGEMIFGKVK